MSILPVQVSRVSTLMQSDSIAGQIDSTEQQLQHTENQLSTGLAFNQPGEDPGAAAIVMQLQRTLQQQNGYLSNLQQSQSQLGEVDSTLNSLTTLVTSATTIASQNVSSDVSASQRAAAAQLVQTMYSQAITLGNTQFEGSYLFGGDEANNAPFVTTANGVQFVDSGTVLQNTDATNTQMAWQVSGAAVFGALSSQVTGSTNLNPALTSTTRISDLRGATGTGVQLGTIEIGNGTTTADVDLSGADTIQDVVNDINKAAVGDITASISGNHLVLSTTGTDNITVTDIGTGTTAQSLGIAQATGGGAGVSLVGSSVQPNVTALTPISALNDNSGIDASSGLIITNGSATATVKFTSAETVGDVLNAINASGTGVQAQINSDGTGINVVNTVQGAQLTIGENGGTTATDLGIRSFSLSTPLSDLNGGTGVQTASSGADFQITDAAGASFTVTLAGVQTVQDVIDKINAAAGSSGVTASFATTGNGIVLTDGSSGSGTLTVTALNDSNAAAELGLNTPASGGVITGTDVNAVQPSGLLTDLANLRDALNSNNQAGITAAAQALQNDSQNITDIRGQAGAQMQELQSMQDSLQTQQTATQATISQLQDADYATTVEKFSTLQTSLQATLMTAARSMSLSLLDFLS